VYVGDVLAGIGAPVDTNLVSSDSDSSILVWCSPKKMDPATTSVSSPRNGDETELEQLSSDLQALKRLYGLLHKGPANEDLDEASRALLMKMLDDATQQTLLKQAKENHFFLLQRETEKLRGDIDEECAEVFKFNYLYHEFE